MHNCEFVGNGISLPRCRVIPWGGTDGGAAALGAGSTFSAQLLGIPLYRGMLGGINPGNLDGREGN